MAQLTGNAIQSSYLGLIKTTDNAAIGAVAKAITDGDGNAINMEIGTGAIKFPSGTVDFTGSTVSGLPVDPNTTYDLTAATIGSNINLELTGSDATTDTVQVTAGSNITLTKNITGFVIDAASGGAAGLESGTGTDSMQSSSALTAVAANASAEATVALGDGAIASSATNIAIGDTANAGGDDSFARGNIAIGPNSDATNEKDVAIGNSAQATGSRSVAVGDGANASGNRSIVVGASSSATAFSSACFGAFSTASAEGATVVGGYGSSATQTDAIAVGKEADALAAGAIAIGKLAQATATDAIALGKDVTGNIASTVSAKALELQTDSTPTAGGIIVSDAGGTDRRINIDASGGLQIDSTPVGGVPDFKVKTTTQVTNTTTGADETLVSLLIPANTLSAGDLIDIYAHVAMDFTGGGSIYFNAGLGPSVNSNIMQVGTGGFSVGAGVSTKRTVAVHVADGTGLASSTPAIDTNARGNTYPMTGYTFPDNDLQALDWTSDMYLNIYVYVDNVGSSATLMSAYAKQI